MNDLKSKLFNIKKIMEEYVNVDSKKTQLKDFCLEVDRYYTLINNLIENPEIEEEEVIQISEDLPLKGVTDRKALKEALLSRSKPCSKPMKKYEKVREEVLTFLSSNFEIYLVHPNTFHFYEIFFFDDISIKDKIIGTHRSAIHNALRDPHYYLQVSFITFMESLFSDVDFYSVSVARYPMYKPSSPQCLTYALSTNFI